MLRNLKAEMVRNDVKAADIGQVIGKSERSTKDKISGRFSFSISEAMKIRNKFFPDIPLDELFAEKEERA
jgi:hypothetical protein|nr:MAG TPA: SOS-response transcriptional repressor [Caudoviricetes sp.]